MRVFSILCLMCFVASCVGDRTAAQELQIFGKLKPGVDGSIRAVAFSPDGKTLAASHFAATGTKATLILWDVKSKKELAAIPFPAIISHIAFNSDGKSLAASHYDEMDRTHHVKILDIESRKERMDLIVNSQHGHISSMGYSPDGAILAVGTGGRPKGTALILFEHGTGKERVVLKGGADVVGSASFSADGKTLVSISDDVLQVWDVERSRLRDSFPVGRGYKTAISPDGRTLAVSMIGSRKYPGVRAVTIRDALSGKERVDLKCNQTAGTLLFTPDGTKLICGFAHGVIKIWDTSNWQELATVDGPNFAGLAYAPYGHLISSGNETGTVWLWDASSLFRQKGIP